MAVIGNALLRDHITPYGYFSDTFPVLVNDHTSKVSYFGVANIMCRMVRCGTFSAVIG